MVSDYSTAYEGLEGQVREDLMELERLVEEAVESERCMTSSSLPEGFETEMTDETDFGFESSKKYDSGIEIYLEYQERSSISFNRPDSSLVEIDVKMPYTFTEHWDQKR